MPSAAGTVRRRFQISRKAFRIYRREDRTEMSAKEVRELRDLMEGSGGKTLTTYAASGVKPPLDVLEEVNEECFVARRP